jgi:hypothetical protein
MHGNYLELNVGQHVFNLYKDYFTTLAQYRDKYVATNNELDISGGLFFALYDRVMKTHPPIDTPQMREFIATLKEIVDELYSGPPIDYVIVRMSQELVSGTTERGSA